MAKEPRASKLYDVDVIPEKVSIAVNSLKAEDLVWKKRHGAEKHEAFEGCYVLRAYR